MLNTPSCSRPEHSSGQHALCCEDRVFKKTWRNERIVTKWKKVGFQNTGKYIFFYKYLQKSDKFVSVENKKIL